MERDLSYDLFDNDYAREITQESDLGHSEILEIATLLIYYCKENLRIDVEVENDTKYNKNYQDLCNILKQLQNNIEEHNNIK